MMRTNHKVKRARTRFGQGKSSVFQNLSLILVIFSAEWEGVKIRKEFAVFLAAHTYSQTQRVVADASIVPFFFVYQEASEVV